ncbi:MAG TPA: PilZ domain-containing protein [Novosphingobium sp.]|nr:PilZ domain-containing protein [Novosphingobium sp.]
MRLWKGGLSILAQEDRRGSERWRVHLIATADLAQDVGDILIQDISETGLRLATAATLEIGETIVVDLPDNKAALAKVVWQRGASYGCEFDSPLSTAVISAVLLQVPRLTTRGRGADERLEEVPVAISPTIDELAEWKAEFIRTKGALGYRLIAFRHTSDGLLIAVTAKPPNLA